METRDALRWLAAAALKLHERQATVDTCLRLIAELEKGRILPFEGERKLVADVAQQLAEAYQALAALPDDDVDARRQEIDTLLDDVDWGLLVEQVRAQLDPPADDVTKWPS